MMRKLNLKNLLKIIIPAAILFFLFYTIINSWPAIKNQLILANPFLLIVSFIVLVATFLGGAFFWWSILKSFNSNIPYFETLKIFTVSNFGRFVPGVVVHYLARIYMLKKIGLGLKESTLTVVIEAYYTFAGAFLIGILGVQPLASLTNIPFQIFLVIYLFFVFVVLVTPLGIFLKIISKLPFLNKKIERENVQFNYKQHFFLCFVSTSLFGLNGLAFYLLSFNFFGLEIEYLGFIVGVFALSWITGFLTPVAPGGLGISDLSFVFLLSPIYTFPEASFLVILYRVWLLISEGFIFGVVMLISKANLFEEVIKK